MIDKAILKQFPKDRSGRFYSPNGKLMCNFEEAQSTGCIQAETNNAMLMFSSLMIVTNINPCNGCPVWDRVGPECGCFQKYHTGYHAVVEEKKQHAAKVKRQQEKPVPPHNFAASCKFVGLVMTSRQLSKFRRQMGLAYRVAVQHPDALPPVEGVKDEDGDLVVMSYPDRRRAADNFLRANRT